MNFSKKRNLSETSLPSTSKKIFKTANNFQNQLANLKQNTLKNENNKFQLLPNPNKILTNKIINVAAAKEKESNISINSDCLVTGNVGFILKMFKLHPEIKSFYEVYGNLVKLIKGKYFGQHIFILKNLTGPVLQGIYYEYEDNDLNDIEIGQFLCCVGKFSSDKKFNIYKLTVISNSPLEETFSRIQSICTFSLNKKSKKLNEAYYN